MRSRAAVILFFLIGLAANALAGPMGGGMGPGMMHNPRIEAELGLSEEQSQRMSELRRAYLDEITPIQSRLFSARLELRHLWEDRVPDKEKISAKQGEIAELERRLDAITTRYRLDCIDVLTPEQREKVEMLKPRQNMGMGWRPGRMHRGWGKEGRMQ